MEIACGTSCRKVYHVPQLRFNLLSTECLRRESFIGYDSLPNTLGKGERAQDPAERILFFPVRREGKVEDPLLLATSGGDTLAVKTASAKGTCEYI
jgi:hypothetical protein